MAHATRAADSELEGRLASIEYAQGIISELAPGRSLAEELIAERHADARAEERAADSGRRGGGR
jgi:hypothetical protein